VANYIYNKTVFELFPLLFLLESNCGNAANYPPVLLLAVAKSDP